MATTPPIATARARPPWWFRLLRALLNLALVVSLVLQGLAFLLLRTHQPLQLPDFVRNAIEAGLRAQGVSVRFSAMEITLTGSLWLREPKIYLAGTPDPVAEAEALQIQPDWLELAWSHKFGLNRLGLQNARLYCPPEISPSGTRETIVGDFDLVVANTGGDWWRLDYLRARILNAHILAQGTFVVPVRPVAPPGVPPAPVSGGPAVPPGKPLAAAPTLAAQYRALARQLEGMQENFALAQNPAVTLRLEGADSGHTTIKVFAQVDGAEPPVENANLTLGRLWARGTAEWDGRTVRAAVPAIVWLESLKFEESSAKGKERDTVAGGPAWLRVQLADGAQGVFGRPSQAWCIISPVTVYGLAFDSMASVVNLTSGSNIDFNYYAARGNYWLKAQGQADLHTRSVALDFGAYADPAVVLAAARLQMPKELASLKFDRPPRLDGHITLAPDFKPEALDFDLQTGGAHIDNINLYALQARGRLTPADLNVKNVTFWNPQWRVQGSYSQNLKTQDFRILARGNLNPLTLDPYMDTWWPQVWAFVVPGASWPLADIDYQGCWDKLANQTLFGSVSLAGGRAKGVLIDDLALRIYLRQDVVGVYDLAANAHGGGALTGAMLWMKMPPYHKNYEIRYLFDSTLPLASAAMLAGNDVVDLTRPLECPTPPHLVVDLRTGGSANPQANVTVTKLQASLPAPFKAYNVPLDSLQGNATIYNSFTDIPELHFGIAGGQVVATAAINRVSSGNELAFNVTLIAGHHTGVLYALSQMKDPDEHTAPSPANVTVAPVGGAPPPTGAAGTPAAPKSAVNAMNDLTRPGKMDLTMGARVLLGNKDSFVAAGHARVYEAKMGQLQLFGPLSNILSGTFMPLGSFDLNAAESDIQIAHQYARFPNLRIVGPSARVVSAGLYNFNSEHLNFTALFFPLSSWNVPVVSQIISLFSSLNNTVTVNLTGTLDNPDWSLNMNPVRMFTAKNLVAPPIPGYPANADGSPVIPPLPFPPPPQPATPLSAPVPGPNPATPSGPIGQPRFTRNN